MVRNFDFIVHCNYLHIWSRISIHSERIRTDWKLDERFTEPHEKDAATEYIDSFRQTLLCDIHAGFEETWAKNEFTDAINNLKQLTDDAKNKNQTNW